MRKTLLLVALVVSGWITAQTLENDPYHSKLGFSVEHMLISFVEGNFTDFNVELTFTKEDLSDAKFLVTAQTNSISTGVIDRDNHLKSADFFEVEKYPELRFSSTSIKHIKDKEHQLDGDLTMHGVTKKVTLTAFYNGNVINPMNNVKTHGFTIKGKINRADFKIGPKFAPDFIGNTVKIVSNLEFPVVQQ